MRTFILLFASVLALATACGGKTAGNGDGDGGSGGSCSLPPVDGCEVDDTGSGSSSGCCFSEPSGDFGSSSCVADDDITSVCPDADSYGYQCVTGDDPSTLDSSLASCSSPTPDADGVHDDFCCTYD